MNKKNGKPGRVRMQTQEELIEALRDQCKFWRLEWAESVSRALEMERLLDQSIEETKKIKKMLEDEV